MGCRPSTSPVQDSAIAWQISVLRLLMSQSSAPGGRRGPMRRATPTCSLMGTASSTTSASPGSRVSATSRPRTSWPRRRRSPASRRAMRPPPPMMQILRVFSALRISCCPRWLPSTRVRIRASPSAGSRPTASLRARARARTSRSRSRSNRAPPVACFRAPMSRTSADRRAASANISPSTSSRSARSALSRSMPVHNPAVSCDDIHLSRPVCP